MNNETITIKSGFIALVHETRDAQKAYFEAVAKAKKTNTAEAWKERHDRLRESKALEASLDEQTACYLAKIRGAMTAEEAIAQMRKDLDSDLEVVRKEANHV